MSNVFHREANNQGLVWDIPVRAVHWILVLSLIFAYITHYLGIEYYAYHVASGYVVIVVAVFRLIWGVLGTPHARFKNFIRGPVETWKYLNDFIRGKEAHHVGHNPLGALMIVMLLSCMLMQAVSGLFTTDDIFNYGPLYAFVSDSASNFLGSVHRNLFYVLLCFVATHVAAIIYHRIIKRENLLKAMITGRKVLPPNKNELAIESSRLTLALWIVTIVSLSFAYLLNMLPSSSFQTF
jgi:cytochrome b